MDQNNLDSIHNSILTLEDLSITAAAVHLCNLINAEKKIKDFLDENHPTWRLNHGKLYQGLHLPKLLEKISEVFSDELNNQGLSETLKPKVLEKGLEISERIHDWILHLIWDLELNSKHIEKVYLTSYGEIDEDKIFKSLWMKYALDRSSFDYRIGNLHYLACLFSQKEYIINNLVEIKNEIHTIIPLEMDVFAIIRFLVCATSKAGQWNKSNSSHTISTRFFSLSNIRLLNICLTLGFYKPFKYFWDHLHEIVKSFYLENMSGTYSLAYYLKCDLKANYVADNLFKILIFLTDKMSASQIDNFILHFFNHWHLIFENIDRPKCLKNFCIRFIQKFLPRLSKLSEMINLNPNFGYEKEFLQNLFDVWEKSLLKAVICHEIYKNRKDYVLDFGKNKYHKLIFDSKFTSLNEFMDLCLKTENEKNHFKMRYNFLQDWVCQSRWHTVHNVLIWMRSLSKTDKRKIVYDQLKYRLDSRHLFLKDNWESSLEHMILELLKWFASTDTKPLINNCEDPSSVINLTREIIYKLWFSSYFTPESNSVATTSSKILKCVFGTENEIINFKKTELAKDEIGVVKFFCDSKLETEEQVRANFFRIDEFFSFCFSVEKMKTVKKLIADDVVAWIYNYGISVQRFNVVVPLIDWICGSRNENCKMLKTYFQNRSELENYYRRLKEYSYLDD